MEVKGKVQFKGENDQVTGSFVKRNLVILTDDSYPQTLCVEFVQDKTSLIDKINVGDNVTIAINIKGREWTKPDTGEVKYFTSINGWKIDVTPSLHEPVKQPLTPAEQKLTPITDDQSDDLPF